MKKLKKVFGRTFLKKNVSFMTKIRPEDVGGVTKTYRGFDVVRAI